MEKNNMDDCICNFITGAFYTSLDQDGINFGYFLWS